jgi:Ankyrin repeats (3 copies)
LRILSIAGDHEAVRSILRNRSNPCSVDEYGITPLMCAVWNGHLECAKWLLANDRGIDNEGVKRSSINMQSIKGYTALHLHCQDSLPWASDVLVWLLAAGADINIRCHTEGMLPEEHAEKANNRGALDILKKFKSLITCNGSDGEPAEEELNEFRKILESNKNMLAKKYAFQLEVSTGVEPWGASFPVPAFIFEPQRVGNLPHGLKIYEHHIKPLMERGKDMMGLDSLRCLSFSESQAEINRLRREEILQCSDPNWQSPCKISFKDKIKVRHVKKRSKDDDEGQEVLPIIGQTGGKK